MTQLNIERWYLEYSNPPPVESLNEEGEEWKTSQLEWEYALFPMWKTTHGWLRTASITEAAARIARCRCTVSDVRSQSVMELVRKTGMIVSDVVVYKLVANAVPRIPITAAQLFEFNQIRQLSVSPMDETNFQRISYLRPFVIHRPRSEHLQVSVRNQGAIGTVELESSYHTTIALIASLSGFFIESGTFHGLLLDTSTKIGLWVKVHMAIVMLRNAIRFASIIHAIIGIIYTRVAMASEYQACHYLSLHWILRHLSAFGVGLTCVLNLADGLLYLNHPDVQWMTIVFWSINIPVFVGVLICFIFALGRGYTAGWALPLQWFRWIPFGKRHMTTEMNKLLLSCGDYQSRLVFESWRDQIHGALAEDIIEATEQPENRENSHFRQHRGPSSMRRRSFSAISP